MTTGAVREIRRMITIDDTDLNWDHGFKLLLSVARDAGSVL